VIPVECITLRPLDPASLARRVESAERGAVVSFVGVVRNHNEGRPVLRLEYSAYAPMAERVCAELVAEVEARWPVAAALAHRVGELAVGDVAMAVVVAAAHRGPAFEACRHLVDEVKRRVPVWKREHYADGAPAWVEPAG
jgi:molybdopterin synthase catalytic subunit